jgi:predicted nucleotidyltransferase
MFDLPEATLKLIRAYFEKQTDVTRVVIYGSRAMGTAEKGSDIDLALWTTADSDISARIKDDLENLSSPYFFDVADYTHLSHVHLKQHIDKVGKELYARHTKVKS